MEKLTIKDSTVEKAIQKGLIKLNTTKENVVVTVLQEGKKGLFGFGQKDAIVEITLKQETLTPKEKTPLNVTEKQEETISVVKPKEEEKEVVIEKNVSTTSTESSKYEMVIHYLTTIAKEYGAKDTVITVKETSKKIIFQIETTKSGLLIGKHGKIINSLQVLAQTIVYREDEKAPMVIVNIGDYRQKREEKLKEIANRTAKRVLSTNQAVFLEALPAFERKIIHAKLSKYDNLTTHSEGKEPHRYLVVSPK